MPATSASQRPHPAAISALAAAALAALAPVATAQPAATAASEAPVASVEVTVQRRTQNIKDVPLSINALTPAFVEDNRIRDFADAAQYVPGFVSSPNYGFILYSSMRGISSNEFGFATDPSIAMYVDGIYQGLSGSQVNAFYDIARVEMVKGPQSTLFGRSSIAGGIAVVTNQPTDRLEAGVTAGLGNLSRRAVDGFVNLPLGTGTALRVAFKHERQDGFLRNLNGGDDISAVDITAARATLRFGQGPLEAIVKLGGERRRQSGNVYQALDLDGFTVDVSTRGRENYADYDIADAVAEIRWSISPAWRLVATASRRTVDNVYQEDFDGIRQVVGGPYYQGQDDRLDQLDARLTWAGSNGAAFAAGANYARLERTAFIGEWVDQTLGTVFFVDPDTVPTDYSQAALERADYAGTFVDKSVFVDGTMPLAERWKLTGGLRWSSNRKQYSQFVHDPTTTPANEGQPVFYLWGYYTSQPITGSRTWDNTSARAALTYDIDARTTAYAAYTQGWKAGGFKTLQVDSAPAFGGDAFTAGSRLSAIEPEESDNVEAGVRGSSADGRLRWGASAFFYKYEGLQKIRIVNAQTFVDNVAAEGKGFEGEFTWAPTAALQWYGNVAYTRTRITDDPATPANNGQPLNLAPEWQGMLGATWTTEPIDTLAGGTLFVGGNVTYRGAYRNDDQAEKNVDSHTLLNLRGGWMSADGRWRATLWVDNALDTFTYGRWLPENLYLSVKGSRSVIGNPRRFGIDVSTSF
jgi:iron complex outermembrane receptor protein